MPIIRQGSMDPTQDPNSVEYLGMRAQDTIIKCYNELKRMGITDISDLYAEGKVILPLQGCPASEKSRIIERIKKYVDKKRREREAEIDGGRTQRRPDTAHPRPLHLIDLDNSDPGIDAIEKDKEEEDYDNLKRKNLEDSLEEEMDRMRPPAKTATDELHELRNTVRRQKEELNIQKARADSLEDTVNRITAQLAEVQKKQYEELVSLNKIIEKLEVEKEALNDIVSGKEGELQEYRKMLGISGSQETYTQAMAQRTQATVANRQPPSRQPNPIRQPPSRQPSISSQPNYDVVIDSGLDIAGEPSNERHAREASNERLAQDILEVVERMLSSRLGITGKNKTRNRGRNRSRSTRGRTTSLVRNAHIANEEEMQDDRNFPPLLRSRHGGNGSGPNTIKSYSQVAVGRQNRRYSNTEQVAQQSAGQGVPIPRTVPANRVQQPRVQTVTVLPKEVLQGELANIVRRQLRYNGISPSTFGVTKCINRADGALIITIPNREQRVSFEKALTGLGYTLVDYEYCPFEIRIHALPEDAATHVIKDEVSIKFGIDPIKVETFPYRKENTKHKGLKFAVIYGNEELYNRMASAKGINIYWQWCRIDAEPRAIKCTNCGTLGHPAKYCDREEEVNRVRTGLEGNNECLDCVLYNTINANNNRQKRATLHKNNSLECPTYRSLAKRKLKQWRVSEARRNDKQPAEGNRKDIEDSSQMDIEGHETMQSDSGKQGGRRATPELTHNDESLDSTV